jgi:hypothetical protein
LRSNGVAAAAVAAVSSRVTIRRTGSLWRARHAQRAILRTIATTTVCHEHTNRASCATLAIRIGHATGRAGHATIPRFEACKRHSCRDFCRRTIHLTCSRSGKHQAYRRGPGGLTRLLGEP